MSGHRPTHRHTVSLLASAWVHVCRGLAATLTILFGALAAWHHDPRWLFAVALGVLVWLIFALLHAFECGRARCATCAGRLFLNTGNAKHSSAIRILGSHQLATALQVIGTMTYRCQHCGTKVCCGTARRDRTSHDPGPAQSLRQNGQSRGSALPAPRSRPSYILQVRLKKPGKND